jgi:hypothetical protein
MSGGIDYSKWDHLDEYSDDDDDEQQDQQGSSPQVTQLDAPSRVTFGGGSAEITAQSAVPTTSRPSAMTVQKSSNPTSNSTITGATTISSKDDNDTSKWTQNGGLVTTETGHKLYWSQDRYAVNFRLALDDHVKASDSKIQVQVEGMLPYSDRHCAMGSTKPILQIMIIPTTSTSPTPAAATSLLQGNLPHPVHWAQEDQEEKIMDWSIERRSGCSTNFLVFSLYKAVPMHGMFVWWRRPLLSFPEVDVPAASSSSTNTSQDFSQAWEEAHRLFREKRASQPQQEVP